MWTFVVVGIKHWSSDILLLSRNAFEHLSSHLMKEVLAMPILQERPNELMPGMTGLM